MQFEVLLGEAVQWAIAGVRALAGWEPLPWVAGGLGAAAAVGLAAFLRRRRRRRIEAQARLAAVVDKEAQALKQELRQRLSEPPQLLDDHLNGAPTMGAREAFENDLEAAASTVLREAGGERSRARELLRKRIARDGSTGSGKLNGTEAGIWRQLGALALVDGSRDAVIAYRRAADLAPDDPEGQLLVGVLQMRSGNFEAAERAFRRQIELAQGPEAAAARYRGRTMLGDVCAARHAPDEALAAYNEAQKEISALLEATPGQPALRRDLSVTHDRIGDILFAKGELPEALESYRRGLVIAEELARSAGKSNLDLHRDLSVSYDRIGDLLDKMGDLAGALVHFKKGLAIAKALARHDPDNRTWAWDLSASYERVADILYAQGKVDEALRQYRQGLAIAEKVVQGGARDAALQRDLAVSYHKVGTIESLRGSAVDARELLEKGRAIIAELDRIAAHRAQWRSDLSKFDAALKVLH